MKKGLLIILSVLVISAFMAMSALAAQKVTIVGDSDYPPYSFDNNGKMDGIYVRILQKIFPQMTDYDVEFKLIPWKRGLALVEKGEALGIVPPYYRPEKRPWIKPYSDPIIKEEVAVFCNKKVLDKPRTKFPEDYYGLLFGNNMGFAAGGKDFTDAVATGKIKMEETKGTDKNLQKLASGRVDCYINDKQAILWSLKQLAADGKLMGNPDDVVESQIISGEEGYIGFSAKLDAADFAAKFNALLKAMKDSGEVDAIIKEFNK
ncbi:substrate-binding periplasmic protein [Salidesulfovibrio onnuriiensis]|uniref:substrate-binding periplasmic protein n=1 Tax=Salidesulfovibrio onnuriiensis TaxID=2583823 RepID=UPI001650451D|nr:transporter substrate-binding domain-containing protein [Salidesulfovibrio onnuriiensis]